MSAHRDTPCSVSAQKKGEMEKKNTAYKRLHLELQVIKQERTPRCPHTSIWCEAHSSCCFRLAPAGGDEVRGGEECVLTKRRITQNLSFSLYTIRDEHFMQTAEAVVAVDHRQRFHGTGREQLPKAVPKHL